MEGFLQDVRFGWRQLLKSPTVTALTVLSLVLGIGVNATVFGYLDRVLLRPLPVKDPEKLVRIYAARSKDFLYGALSYPEYKDLARRNPSFSGVIAERFTSLSFSRGTGEPNRIWGSLVSGNYFSDLGVHAEAGRLLTVNDDVTPGGHPVAVISHAAWQRRFGGEPSAIGSRVILNGHPFEIVGVAPRGFAGTSVGLSPEVWVPMAMQMQAIPGSNRLERRDSRWLTATGRLKAGVGMDGARAGLEPLAHQIAQENPDLATGLRFHLVPLSQDNLPLQARDKVGVFLAALMGLAGLVLLIACANLTNLLLARSLSRRGELAVRLAMGVGRGRLIRQLLTESLLMAALAGAVSLLVTFWLQGALGALRLPTSMPLDAGVGLDGRTLLFTAVLSLVAGVLFGLAPALQGAETQLALVLKGTKTESSGRRAPLRSILIVSQVALCLVLLTGAGLFVRSLWSALDTKPGFDTEHVLLGSIDLHLAGYTEERGKVFYQQLLDRVRALPNVKAAGLSDTVPLEPGGEQQLQLAIDGYQAPPGEGDPSIDFSVVSPGYFDAMNVPVLQGKTFSRNDPAKPGSAIINATMAARFWPGESPLGKRLRLGDSPLFVVGVVRDVKSNSLSEAPHSYLYLSSLQQHQQVMTLHVRTSGDPSALVPAVKQEIQALDPTLPLADIRTMEQQVRVSLLPARLAAWFFGGFGLLALVLTAVGIYGVMGYVVRLRKHELGIRVAVGAQRADILKLVLRQGMTLVAIGLALGLVAAFFLGRKLSGMLYQLSGTDPVTFIEVVLFLIVVSAVANLIPATRASRTDPMDILR
jgi:macrolide transport system ATP-binding/permease protein